MKFLLLLFMPFLLLANGGPIGGYYSTGGGNIAFEQNENITLDAESLHVVLGGISSNVLVNYRFYNNGPKQDVTILFPVDYTEYTPENREKASIDLNYFSASYGSKKSGFKKVPSTVREISPRAIKIEHQRERSGRNEHGKIVKRIDTYIENRDRVWFEFTIPFSANEYNQVIIEYDINNSYEDFATNKSPLPEYSKRSFGYTFKPAQYWGNGVIRDFKIVVDASEMEKSGAKIETKSSFDMNYSNGVYRYSKENMRPGESDDIRFDMDLQFQQLMSLINRSRDNLTHVTTATSTLKGNYSVKNLYDGNRNTAWVEGTAGLGIGEEIVIDLSGYSRINSVYLLNGYQKSDKLYNANGRVSELGVRLEYYPSFKPDSLAVLEYTLGINDWDMAGMHKTVYPVLETIFEGGEGFAGHKPKKLTLKILKATAGASYKDVCISELYIDVEK